MIGNAADHHAHQPGFIRIRQSIVESVGDFSGLFPAEDGHAVVGFHAAMANVIAGRR